MSKVTMSLLLGVALGLIVMLIPYSLFPTTSGVEGWQKGAPLWPTYHPQRIEQEALKEPPTDRSSHPENLVVMPITWADVIKITIIITLGVVPAFTISIITRRRAGI